MTVASLFFMLLIIHVSMNIFDSTCGRVESHVGDISLEEGTAAQFDETELGCMDIKGCQLLLLAIECQADAARHVDVETAFFFVFRCGIFLCVSMVQVFNRHVIRNA